MDKEYVLVCQGLEIMRTKSQEKAIKEIKENNDKYFEYLQECYDDYETPADSYIELFIEDGYEKQLKEENELLKKRIKNLETINDEHRILNGMLNAESENLKNNWKELKEIVEEQINNPLSNEFKLFSKMILTDILRLENNKY